MNAVFILYGCQSMEHTGIQFKDLQIFIQFIQLQLNFDYKTLRFIHAAANFKKKTVQNISKHDYAGGARGLFCPPDGVVISLTNSSAAVTHYPLPSASHCP